MGVVVETVLMVARGRRETEERKTRRAGENVPRFSLLPAKTPTHHRGSEVLATGGQSLHRRGAGGERDCPVWEGQLGPLFFKNCCVGDQPQPYRVGLGWAFSRALCRGVCFPFFFQLPYPWKRRHRCLSACKSLYSTVQPHCSRVWNQATGSVA